VKRVYLLKKRYPIPDFMVWVIVSWVVSLLAFTAMGIAISAYWGPPDLNLLDAFPGPVAIIFALWAIYTFVGASTLWIALWLYWAHEEKSSFPVRLGWFLALLFGVYYGGLIYALYLWREGRIMVATSHRALRRAK